MKRLKNIIYGNAFWSTFIGGILFLIIIFILNKYVLIKIVDLKPENLIISATFIAILWYSLETRLLKNATNIANSINSEPFLALQNEDGELFIINYGKGPAFNIRIQIKNIQGLFNFYISNQNPLMYLERKILESQDEDDNKNNVIAEVILFFDKAEGDNLLNRNRSYRVSKMENCFNIELLS